MTLRLLVCCFSLALSFSLWVSQPSSASADAALVAPVRVDALLDAKLAARTKRAIETALRARGYHVVTSERDGDSFRACKTSGCTEQVLRAAGECSFGIAATVWRRKGGQQPQLALTLIDATSHQSNAAASIDDELVNTVERLVDEVLAAWRVEPGVPEVSTPELPDTTLPSAPLPPTVQPKKRGHGWLAGPISIIALGAGTVGSIGIASAIKGNDEQINKASAATWGTIGAAAIGAGVAWWVVGTQNRKRTRGLSLQLSPTYVSVEGKF